MIKLEIENSKIKLSKGKYNLVFSLSDSDIFASIKSYVEKEKCTDNITLSVVSLKEKYLNFSTGYRILLTDLSYYEIAGRMVLLNDEIKYPEVKTEE